MIENLIAPCGVNCALCVAYQWLGGSNRKVKADCIDLLSRSDMDSCRLSAPALGVDALIYHYHA
jgi:hypothetical protein